MRARAAAALLLLALAGCDRAGTSLGTTPGARLEAAAMTAGLVPDAASGTLTGVWARDTDRVCVVPGSGAEERIGAMIDYGDGQGCAARGTARHLGSTVRIAFGACSFDAGFDGNRISFPAELPRACTALCRGRATFDAMAVDRLSGSRSEAAAMVGFDRKPLC